MRPTYIYLFYNKMEWNKLVEYGAYLPFVIKVKCDSYCGTEVVIKS